jgi:hypothetical protein
MRRAILRQYAEQVCQTLESAPGAFSVPVPLIAARCLVGAVFESLCSWLEESPNDRQSAAEVAHAVADYNLRAIGAEMQNESQSSDKITG